jgi:NAD+ diphosphatase
MPERNTFTGAGLDRAILARADQAWLAERRRDPASAVLVLVDDDRVLVRGDDRARLALLPLARTPLALEPDPVLLGLLDGRALFAARAASDNGGAPAGVAIGLREAGETLSQQEGGLAAYAAGLLNWHRRHPFCSVCGTRAVVAAAGHERHCPTCHTVHHPRIDPVVIMLVSDGERILLGRRRSSPPGRLSVLAGFVEPGESLEEAVTREVLEESGVVVADVRYAGSQPWPFPGQLMVGFGAHHASGEPAAGDDELELVGWYDRQQVARAAQGRGEFALPGRVAIARRLIDGWLASGPPAHGVRRAR